MADNSSSTSGFPSNFVPQNGPTTTNGISDVLASGVMPDATQLALLQQAIMQAALQHSLQTTPTGSSACALETPNGNNNNAHSINGILSGVTTTTVEMQEQQERICSHPLFRLVKTLLLKCEEVTWCLQDDTIEAAQAEIAQMLEALSADGEPSLLTGDTELDSVMCLAVQILRVQLQELASVNTLADQFCHRFRSLLKSEMSQEALLGFGTDDDEELSFLNELSSSLTPCSSVPITTQQQHAAAQPVATQRTAAGTTVTVPLYVRTNSTTTDLQMQQLSNGGGVKTSPNSLLNEDDFDDWSTNSLLEGGGLLRGSTSNSNSANRRSSLPKKAVDALRQWLFQHVTHPYPSEAEKRTLANETGLNLIQVNNWFINARRRVLQPMLDPVSAASTIQEVNNITDVPLSTNNELACSSTNPSTSEWLR